MTRLALVLMLVAVATVEKCAASSSTSGSSSAVTRTIIDRKGKIVIQPPSEIIDSSEAAAATTTTTSTSSKGIVTIVTSPDVPSTVLPSHLQQECDDALLFVYNSNAEDNANVFVCQGATLRSQQQQLEEGKSEDGDEEPTKSNQIVPTNTCLYACGVISDVIVVEGITDRDCSTSIVDTRHAVTLSSIFAAALVSSPQDLQSDSIKKKTIIVAVTSTTKDESAASNVDENQIKKDLQFIYQSVLAAHDDTKSLSKKFDDLYDVQVVSVDAAASTNDRTVATKILSDAIRTAKERMSETEEKAISSTILDAVRIIRESKSSKPMYDIPSHVQAMATINTIYIQLLRTVRAKVIGWKGRISRGLIVDQFGADATTVRQRILSSYDLETVGAVGASSLPVIKYRYNLRQELQSYIDTSVQQAFKGQVTNLEKSTIKRLNTALLQSLDMNKNTKESVETITGNNAATMRKEALLFEKCIENIEVPALGLFKDQAVRDIATKLNTALTTFPDSPAAKIKRFQQVTKVVNKEKRPGQRSISFGLDLVAMLRPDGFGSLQGFAGYQLPGGNSITFGVHNDADDPQVIAQFGGVRPPLLRVQPKLRVDVEM